MRPGDDRAAASKAARIGRRWAQLVDGMAALGTLMIAALMLMISADIVARNLVGGSLPLISELGALTLVMIVALQLGSTVRHGSLARVELVAARLQASYPRLQSALACLWDVAGAAACAAIAWSTLGILRRDLASWDYIGVTGIMTLPVWPFRALILAGLTVAAIQFLVGARAAFVAAARPGSRPA